MSLSTNTKSTKSNSKRNGKAGSKAGNTAPQAAAEQPVAPQASAPVVQPVASAALNARQTLDTSKVIKLLVPQCPKRPGTTCYTRAIKYWEAYAKGGTVQQALDAGATRADIKWDLDHKFIELA